MAERSRRAFIDELERGEHSISIDSLYRVSVSWRAPSGVTTARGGRSPAPSYRTTTVNIAAFSAGAFSQVRPYPKVIVVDPVPTSLNVQR